MVESECQCSEFGSQVTTGPGVTQWLLTPQCQYILSSVNWGWLERGSVTETGARLIYKCEEPPPESNIKTQGTFVINDDFLIMFDKSLHYFLKSILYRIHQIKVSKIIIWLWWWVQTLIWLISSMAGPI